MIEFSPQVVFEHLAQTHCPRGSQQTTDRLFDEGDDNDERDTRSSTKILSDGQRDALTAVVGQTIFEQSTLSSSSRQNISFDCITIMIHMFHVDYIIKICF